MERTRRTAVFQQSINQLLVLLFLMAGLVLQTRAQSTATLQGTVTDPGGSIVPDAKVVATNAATSIQASTTTDSAGSFLFSALSIGAYKLEISVSGFQNFVLIGLKLDVASTVTKNVQLTIGQNSQTVEVTAQEPLVETSNNTMGR